MIIRSATFRSLILPESQSICSRCLLKLAHPAASSPWRQPFSNSATREGRPEKQVPRRAFKRDYFSAYDTIDRRLFQQSPLASVAPIADPPTQTSHDAETPAKEAVTHFAAPEEGELSGTTEELPHRRRKRLKEEAALKENQALPLDASSQLTTTASNLPPHARFRRLFATYLSLSKPRLSFLIVLTTSSAYSLYPTPEILSSATTLPQTSLSTSTLTLLFLTAGTFLSCASTNTLNMLYETKSDGKMTRTRNRPLVRKLLSPRAAVVFSVVTGAAGLTALYFGTNPTVAFLSGLNIMLYAGLYTPMKHMSALNTWVGAIVGGIPPLMGWAAAAGQTATAGHEDWRHLLFNEDGSSIGGWLLAGLLFAWQFPHFNALSHPIREEYKAAGLKMLCWTNPARNGRVALRYTLLLFPICAGLYYCGVVNGGFLVGSTVLNGWMLREAYRFWKYQGAKGSARGLFWASIWQLPLVLIGGLVFKKGIWEGVWERGLTSEEEDAEDDALDAEEAILDQAALSVEDTRKVL